MRSIKNERSFTITDTLRRAYNRSDEAYEAFIWYDLAAKKKLKGYELIKVYEQVINEYVQQPIDSIYHK